MNLLNKTRLSAIFIHLGLSTVVAMFSIGLVYGIWYPAPLSTALGLNDIFLMLLGIDICLGPVLTGVIYNPKKASLKMDLLIVAILQLSALTYGLYTVGSARPAFIVFTADRFDLVQAYEVAIGIKGDLPINNINNINNTNNNSNINNNNIKDESATPPSVAVAKKPEIQLQNAWLQPLFGYQLAFADFPRIPENYGLLNKVTMSALNGGPDIPHLINFHRPYTEALPKIQKIAKKWADLPVPKSDDLKNTLKILQTKYPKESVLVPLKIKFTIYTVVLNYDNGVILGIEPIDVF